MVKNHEDIKKEFTNLTSVNPSSPSHLPSLYLFGNYLQYAVNNMEEAKKPLRQAHLTSQAVAAAGLDKSNANAKSASDLDACIFILSAEQKDLGRVCTSNGEVLRYFGWTVAEVENKQIEEFMPRVLADQHQAFMKRVFNTTDMKAIEKVRPIFAMDRLGFAIALRLVVRVLPRIDGGLRLVGTFTPPEKELEQAPVLVLNAKDGNLEAVTYNSYVRYGIHPSLCSDANRRKIFSILNLFPRIRTLDELIDAANRRSEVLIDTTKLLNREITPGYVWRDSRLPERQSNANSSHKVKLSIHSRSTHGAKNFELVYLLVNPLNIGPADNQEMNFFLDMAAQFKSIRPVRSKSRPKEPTVVKAQVEHTETQSKASKSSVLKFQRSVKTLGLLSKKGLSRLKTNMPASNPMISELNRTQTIAEPEAESAEDEQNNWEKEQARREHLRGRNGRVLSVFVLYLVNLCFAIATFFTVYRFQAHRYSLDEMKLSILSSATQLQYQLTRSLVTSQALYLAGFRPAMLQPQGFSTNQAEQNLALARTETNSLVKVILSKSDAMEAIGLQFMQKDIHEVFSPGLYEGNLDGQKYTLGLTLSELAYTIVNFLEGLLAITLTSTGRSELHKSYLTEAFYFLQKNTFTSLESELQAKVQLLEGFFRESILQVTWANQSLLIGIFLFVLLIESLSLFFFIPVFQSIAHTVVPFGLLPAEDLQLLYQRADDYYEENLKIVQEDSEDPSEDESSFHTDSSGQSELDPDKKVPERSPEQQPSSNNAICNFFTAFNPQASISISRTTSLRSIEIKEEQNQKGLRYQRSKSFNKNDEQKISPESKVSNRDRELGSPSKADLEVPSLRNLLPNQPTTLVSLIANGPTPKAAEFRVGQLAPKKKQVRVKFTSPTSPRKKVPELALEGKASPVQRRKFRFTTTKVDSFHQLNKEKYGMGGLTTTLKPETEQIEELPLSPTKPLFQVGKKSITKKKQTILAAEQPSEQEILAIKKKALEDRTGKRKLFASHFLSIVVVVCLLFPTASLIIFRESTSSAVIDTVTDFTKLIFRNLNAMEKIEASALRLMLVSEDFTEINFDGLMENVRRIESSEEEIRQMVAAMTAMEIDQKGLPATIKEALVLYLDLANQPVCGPNILSLVSAQAEDAITFRAACQANPNPDKGLDWLVTQVQLQGTTVKEL